MRGSLFALLQLACVLLVRRCPSHSAAKFAQMMNALGYVLGGAPIKVEQITKELGRSDHAIRRDPKALRSRYLQLRWTHMAM